MATTENGIYYPNDGKKAADVLADLKAMAESIDKNIQENKFDDKDVKKDISDIKKEQQTQNSDIENLQTNDSKQDLLISKLKNAALNAKTEEAKSLHIKDANKFGSLEVLGNHEQETREGNNLYNLNDVSDKSSGVVVDEDDWIEISFNETKQDITYMNYMLKPSNKLKTNSTYYLILEIKELSGSGNLNVSQYLDSSKSQIETSISRAFSDLSVGIKKYTVTTIDDFSDIDYMIRTFASFNIGQTGKIVFRLSLLEQDIDASNFKYEKYGASPSINYPSPVKCLGSNKNIFSDNDTYNGYIGGEVGQEITYNSSTLSKTYKSCCKLIKNKNYTLSFNKNNTANTNVKVCAIADEDENILEIFNLNPTEETLLINPAQTGYLYLVMDINATNIKIEEGTEATSYSPYGQGSTKISKINKNRFNKNTAVQGYRLDASGEYFIQSNYFTSDYILAKPLTYYAVNYTVTTAMQRICFYDKNKNFISANISSNIFQTPENCKYIRICNELTYLDTAQLEENKNSTDFVEHQQTDYILNIQQEMLKGDYFVKEADGWKEVHSWNKIESYNGESITTEYISTTGELTIGATIFYKTEQYKLPCTEEQIAVLEELNNLDLYKPVTNIITTEDIALLKLKYALDVKTYVNNQLANVNAQILNMAGGN